jgi:hypothetical protein
MSTKPLKKVVIAVALTLAVMFGTGLGDTMLGLSMTPSAYACGGPGMSSGGGGGC